MTTDGYTLACRAGSRIRQLIHVHASDREIGKIYIPAIGIQAGPNAFAKALRRCEGGWVGLARAARQSYECALRRPGPAGPGRHGRGLRLAARQLPEDVILTNGAGNFTVWPNKFLRFGPKARLLAPQSGAMGYGLPAAIAAKVAFPSGTSSALPATATSR